MNSLLAWLFGRQKPRPVLRVLLLDTNRQEHLGMPGIPGDFVRLKCTGSRAVTTPGPLTTKHPLLEGHIMAHEESTVEYRNIPGFPGYRVGSDGSVWSCWKCVSNGQSKGTRRAIGGTWLRMKGSRDDAGYVTVGILNAGKIRVHTLVLAAFVGPRPDGMECCHNDGDPTNNHLDNLRWDTRRGNLADMVRHGRSTRGTRHHMNKLTPDDVQAIRARLKSGERVRQISDDFGVSDGTVYAIKKWRSWRHLPEHDSQSAESFRETSPGGTP